MSNTTEQEVFWQGDFGDEYSDRNRGDKWVAANAAFFSKVFYRTHGIDAVLELGANIGLKLMAIKQLLPDAKLSAVEINGRGSSRAGRQCSRN